MMRTRLVTLLSAALVAAASPAFAQTRLDLATTYSGSNIFAESVREFSDRVKNATDGQVLITVHEGGALGLKDEDHFSAVADGIAPLANVLMGAAVGSSPIFGLSTSPFLVHDFEEARLLHDIARPYYEQEAERFNQKILFTAPWPPSGIHAKRPVLEYEDIAGLRIRTYDRNGTEVLNRAGANALVMSWGDVYPALATGTIDSVLTSAQSGVSGSFWEVLSNYSRVNFAFPLNMVNINLDSWNSLTEEQRTIIEEIGRDMEERQWRIAREVVAQDEQTLADNGMLVVTQISSEFAARLEADGQDVIDNWRRQTGETGRAILDEFEAKR
jgi:TRAP-type C4-dicarboxylate transport system substrate-binding protein